MPSLKDRKRAPSMDLAMGAHHPTPALHPSKQTLMQANPLCLLPEKYEKALKKIISFMSGGLKFGHFGQILGSTGLL